MIFNLGFPKNTILSWFFLFFLIIDLYVLIPTVTAQTFNPNVELAMTIEIPNCSKAKAETETHSMIIEI